MIAYFCCCSNIITNDKITNDKIMLPRQLASGGQWRLTQRDLAAACAVFSSLIRMRQLPIGRLMARLLAVRPRRRKVKLPGPA